MNSSPDILQSLALESEPDLVTTNSKTANNVSPSALKQLRKFYDNVDRPQSVQYGLPSDVQSSEPLATIANMRRGTVELTVQQMQAMTRELARQGALNGRPTRDREGRRRRDQGSSTSSTTRITRSVSAKDKDKKKEKERGKKSKSDKKSE